VESIATERKLVAGVLPGSETNGPMWGEVSSRVEAYLAAWQIGDEKWRHEAVGQIMEAARRRWALEPEVPLLQVAVDAADEWLGEVLRRPYSGEAGEGALAQAGLALALGRPIATQIDPAEPAQVAGALRQGELRAELLRGPTRAPESRAMKMQTSLSRLPSIRLIAGWAFLVALLFVVFFVTR
jgi:hypothetical protein